MNLAIVHDWFVNYMGSEKCIESFTNIWNEAEIYSLVDFLDDEERDIILKGKHAHTSLVQKLPFAKKAYRNYFSVFPYAIEQLDVSSYDVILSSSHSFAKGLISSANQMHVCYCHTPIRYAWDLYHQYIRESNLEKGIRGWLAKRFLHKIRMWDFSTSNRVDYFIANSKHVAKRINKLYRKEAAVIYPPVDVDKFKPHNISKDDYYLIVARFVPYKKVDLVVEAFAEMPDRKLVVIGSGPDEAKIKAKAASNIELLPFQQDDELVKYMQNAKAFLFAAEEDFGITIVEAQASGTPVIAYGLGGATETVIENETGLFFGTQNTQAIKYAVDEFEKNYDNFEPLNIIEHSETFSRSRFEKEMKSFVEVNYSEFKS